MGKVDCQRFFEVQSRFLKGNETTTLACITTKYSAICSKWALLLVAVVVVGYEAAGSPGNRGLLQPAGGTPEALRSIHQWHIAFKQRLRLEPEGVEKGRSRRRASGGAGP